MKRRPPKLAPVPTSCELVYEEWLRLFPETRQGTTMDLFYLFARSLLHSRGQKRDPEWLRKRPEEDRVRIAPKLSDDDVVWYCERFTVLHEDELAKDGHTMKLYAHSMFEEDSEALYRGMRQPGEKMTNDMHREIRRILSEEHDRAGGGQSGGQTS